MMTRLDIQKRSNSIHNNEYEIIGEYKGINSKCLTRHICGYEWEMNLNNHIYKKKGCPKCSGKLPLNIVDIQSSSDYIHNNEYDIIKIFDKSNKKYLNIKHIECNNIFDMMYSNHIHSRQGCPKCRGNNKLNIDVIRSRIYDLHKDEYKLMSNFYENINTKVTIEHKICGHIWNISCNNFLNKKRRCPKCYKPDKLTISKIQEKSNNIHDNKYKILSENYINSDEKILIRHLECGYEWEVFILNHLNKKTGCPKCNTSKGELEISNFLDINDIKYEREYKFIECRSVRNYPLRFDFYLPDLNTCIEYDGELHFNAYDHFGGHDKLTKIQENDSIKNNYCNRNNINLIRISYSNFNQIFKILTKNILNND